MRKAHKEQVPVNHALMNTITPIDGIEFRRNGLEIGENTGRIYGVIKYPPQVEVGWLSKISNIPGTIISIMISPVDNSALMEAVSRNIIQNRGIAESTKDPLTRQRAEKGALDGEKLLTQIDQNGEMVGTMSCLIMPVANEENSFVKVCRRSEGYFAGIHCKIRGMANLQKNAFKSISPYYTGDEIIENITQKIVPMSTFAGGFPFSASGLNDGEGYYFGRDVTGGIVVLDTWRRGGDRTNSNWVVMGVAGVGKSTTIKHIIISEYLKGTKIIMIDPDSEYKDICAELGGDWINAAGGKGGKINPLQVRPMPEDDDDEADPNLRLDTKGMGDLALHMKSLEIFFDLYVPNLTDIQKAMIKEVLEELYVKFGITWDTDITTLKNTDFPIFSDLYNMLVEKSKTNNDYTVLASLMRDIAVGADSFIWNGHTTIETHSRCVCLDTNGLQGTSDTVKKTQYFNLLTWAWEQMSKDREEKVLLICDEAYLMIDPNVPQSLVFLRNVAKRARKYEAALAIISHSVVDFLDPSIKMYGQALLDIPCFKLLMGTDGINHKEISELYNLTEAEQDVLAAKQRGVAIFLVGSKRLYVNFDLPDYEMAIIGKRGGR